MKKKNLTMIFSQVDLMEASVEKEYEVFIVIGCFTIP